MKKSQKKTTKVKKKVVKSKNKKVVKKKVSNKKILTKNKKTLTKTAKKKKTLTKTVKNKKTLKRKIRKTRKTRKRICMEDIYSILNKVQFGKKNVTFATDLIDAPTIENNIKDSELRYNKVEMKTQVVFTLYPDENRKEEDILCLEILDDEIPDIEQIFG